MAGSKEQRLIELVVKAVGDADIKRLGREMQAMRKEATASRKGIDSLNAGMKGMASVAKTAAAGLAAFMSVRAVVGVFNELSQAMDNAAKDSQKFGVTAETLTRLQYAAKISGADVAQLGVGLQKLTKNMATVDTATTPAAKALRALGITAKTDVNEAMGILADQFANMPDGAQKAALAMEVFGKSGTSLIPMLNEGRAGLKQLTDEADRFGATISTKAARAAEDFNDNMMRLKTAAMGAAKNFTAGLMPALKTVTDQLVRMLGSSKDFESFGEAAGEALYWIADKVIYATGWVRRIVEAFRGLADAAKSFATGGLDAMNASLSRTADNLTRIQTETEQMRYRMKLASAYETAGYLDKRGERGTGGVELADEAFEKEAKAAKEVTKEKEKARDFTKEELADIHQHVIAMHAEAELMKQMEVTQRALLDDLEAMQPITADLRGFWAKSGVDADLLRDSVSDLADGLVDVFSGAEKSFSNFLRTFLAGIAKMIAQQMLYNAIAGALKSWGVAGFADGGVFAGGRQVQAFAGGGIVGGPTMFPMRGGRTGLMGERGPEAIMPLARTSDGRLGVATSGGGGNVTIVNNTGVAANAKVRQDSEGRMEIIMEAAQLGANMAESRTERSVRSGYGGLSRGLQSTYGLRRRG
jgi:hypothetical protein